MFGANPPAPPDAFKTAYAQQQSNISVAIANTMLSNADEDTPESTLDVTIAGTYALVDPQYDSTGASTGTTTRSIPRLKRVTSYKAASQAVFDKNLSLREKINDLGIDQVVSVNDKLNGPFSLTTLPSRVAAPVAATLTSTPVTLPALVTALGFGDTVTHLATVRDAIDDRVQYQIGIDIEALRVQLLNGGIVPGMAAYDRAMYEFSRQSTDARRQNYLTAGQEQSRLVLTAIMIQQFQNDAITDTFKNQMIILDFGNNVSTKRFDMAMLLTQYADSLREDNLKEKISERTQTMNELSSLIHGGQINIPQFQAFRAGQIGQTPISDNVWNNYSARRDSYMQKSQSQSNMFSAILGFGANMVSGGALG